VAFTSLQLFALLLMVLFFDHDCATTLQGWKSRNLESKIDTARTKNEDVEGEGRD
jgi:hypothetical protein